MKHSNTDCTAEQEIVNLVSQTYDDVIEAPDFGTKLQAIKAHFVKRDFEKVFSEEHLNVYIVAYVPTRALTYHELFTSEKFLLDILKRPELKICCLGGGPGSELMGIASACHFSENPFNLTMNVHDMADWTKPLAPLLKNLENQWNIGLNVINYQAHITDILDITNEQLLMNIKEADLITLMFTINELFKDKAKALDFLSKIRENMKKGAFLFIVDSAGDFSEIQVGTKTYMVYNLLDYLKGFKKILSEDARWYRLPPGLSFPVKLQNQSSALMEINVPLDPVPRVSRSDPKLAALLKARQPVVIEDSGLVRIVAP